MKFKGMLHGFFTFCATAILVLDSSTALKGCTEGLELCLRSVIPALFPFLVLSPMLVSSIQFQLPKVLRRFTKLPKGADGLLIAGCLGGYPVGAQCIANAAQSNQISKTDAHRLMAFCCNCGPGFIFGLCSSFFSWRWAAWGLWLCHIGGAILVGWLTPAATNSRLSISYSKVDLTQALARAVKVLAQICGWVILFRCILKFLQKWIFLHINPVFGVLLTGGLELTNGCLALAQITDPGLRFTVCEAMLSLGGLCVAMQTACVAKPMTTGLYIPGKLAQTVLSSLLAHMVWAFHIRNWHIATVEAFTFLALLAGAKAIAIKKENYSRNLQPIVV